MGKPSAAPTRIDRVAIATNRRGDAPAARITSVAAGTVKSDRRPARGEGAVREAGRRPAELRRATITAMKPVSSEVAESVREGREGEDRPVGDRPRFMC